MDGRTAFPVAERFGLSPSSVRDDIALSGSPARSVARLAVEVSDGRIFAVEEIPEPSVTRKRAIARTVARLRAADPRLPVPGYLESEPGETVLSHDGRHYQVVPYVPGVPLDREAYLDDDWRGPAMARFLVRMRKAVVAAGLDRRPESVPFLLREYARAVASTMEQRDPETLGAVRPVLAYLESGYFSRERELPVSFCHGDYHPVNIVWGRDTMNAVIDWEFSGPKPELYDAANMVGCLGMEDPAVLTHPIVTEFLSVLRREGDFSEESWRTFPDLVLTLRFAWLSEWLRFREPDMVSLETTYMDMLLSHGDDFAKRWNLS